MATALHWIPDTLYNYSLAAVAANSNSFLKEIRTFHENMLFDIYYQLYKEGHLKKLSLEFSNIDIFRRLLKVKDKRCLLHNCFQAVMDHGCPIAEELAHAYQSVCSSASNLPNSSKLDTIYLGFSLGNFLIDAGWFPQSEIIFLACLSLCYSIKANFIWKVMLQCYARLLLIRNFYCKFEEARATYLKARECIKKIKDLGLKVNFSSVYGEFSLYYFSISSYKEAYRWSIEALNELNSCLYPKEVIRILCQASKACVLKREFRRSEMLIKQALHMAEENYGSHNLVFASVLLDYGYHLLSVDSIHHALKAYQTALSLHTRVFGGNNLLVAKCHEDLAYASYVAEYNTGRFKDGMDHADKALSIMHNLSIEDSFLLVFAKKAKALILEELAIDYNDAAIKKKFFAEAQELHSYGFQLAVREFGELNLLTAKYYGNLGRLFQSMRKYEEAQKMMRKAIAIRGALLEPDDYEIAISVSQLASLYAYDMELYQEAEALFLKSIEIGRKIFGEGYSFLEYDYKGLIKIYTHYGLRDEVFKYRTMFHNWKEIRDRAAQAKSDFSLENIDLEPIAPEDMMSHFIAVQ